MRESGDCKSFLPNRAVEMPIGGWDSSPVKAGGFSNPPELRVPPAHRGGPPAPPDLPLANQPIHAKSASIMLTGIIIALLFLGAGVIVFTYLKKGAM
jgi:hypothetical protein